MKDSYYFSHDSNARNDPKIIRLRRLFGLEGYGLFWCVVEMLRDASDFQLSLNMIEDMIFEFRVKPEIFEALFNCELLKKDDSFFWSESLRERMKMREIKREQASKAGRTSAERRLNERSTEIQRTLNGNSTNVERTFNGNLTDVERTFNKERKGKETKAKEIKAKEKTFSEVDFQMGEFLLAQIIGNFPQFKKPNLENWAKEFSLIRENDQRPPEETKRLIEWAQNDNFWKANILCPNKLRKQWDSLNAKSQISIQKKKELEEIDRDDERAKQQTTFYDTYHGVGPVPKWPRE